MLFFLDSVVYLYPHLHYSSSFVCKNYHYNLASRIILNPNMFHNMTQNPNLLTMGDLPKDDNFPNFQRGLELFNDTELPLSLRCSCLALVAEQKIRSNSPTSSAHLSPNKK
jgi:hypothetical protein